MEFEPLSRFLEATNIVATRLPGRTPWSSLKVVENDDSFVAFCESTGESREVPRADVICHQLNCRQLAAELNAALSLGRKPEWLDSSRRVWFLGNQLNKLAWSLTVESSATCYCTIAQGEPMKVVVSDLKLAESQLSLTPESVPSLADIVLIETHNDAAFFANEQDEDGVRYASRIQTWIELNAGHARQHETAKNLYQSIIKASKA